MDPLFRGIRLELEEPYARGTRWGTAIIGTYYLALLPIYISGPGGWRGTLALLMTFSASMSLLGIAYALRRTPTVPDRSERLATVGCSVVLVQMLTNILVLRHWNNTSDLMILVVALAFIVRRSTWFFAMLLAASGVWWIAAGLHRQEPSMSHWALGMVSATLAAVVIHFHQRRMWAFQEDLVHQGRILVEEKEKLIGQLEEALENVKTLRGLIPICAHCKKVRNDKGFWEQVETFVQQRSEAQFSHGICPDCLPSVRAEIQADMENFKRGNPNRSSIPGA